MNDKLIIASVIGLVLLLTACTKSAKSTDQEAARRSLAQKGITYSEQAFTERVKNGDNDAVSLFLVAGMSPNAKDERGYPALMIAAMEGARECAEHLIVAGADFNARNNDGQTPLMGAALEGQTSMLRILLDSGADINARDKFKFTALMYADSRGHKDALQLLLNAGAQLLQSDQKKP